MNANPLQKFWKESTVVMQKGKSSSGLYAYICVTHILVKWTRNGTNVDYCVGWE